jgi:DNA-binding helix-hairpin-helix protein with protein kinase domain
VPTHTGRQGKVYNLAPRPFAGGGEGDIYEIANAMHLVAKKYKPKRVTTEREQKIIAMLGNPPSAQVIGQFAWPVDMLYENRQFAGYVMPRLQTPRALNDVYVYDDRKGIPWYFYISVAKNLAAVINAAHKIGHVCGDLNPDNISVDQQGVITLLDTDSYHIYDKVNSRTFRCEVGRPEYVPRELQGLHLGSAPLPTYTEETDNFTLAVLIFCLLMNGSHPFACAVTRQSVSASKFQPVGNITKGLFPFMQTQTSLSIPKYAPPITILNDELQELFKRAFVDGHRNPKARPKPDEWYYALDHLNRSLKKCANDNTHLYYAGLNDCPWCEVENKMNKAKVQGPASKPNIQQQPINKPGPLVQTTKATPVVKGPVSNEISAAIKTIYGIGITLMILHVLLLFFEIVELYPGDTGLAAVLYIIVIGACFFSKLIPIVAIGLVLFSISMSLYYGADLSDAIEFLHYFFFPLVIFYYFNFTAEKLVRRHVHLKWAITIVSPIVLFIILRLFNTLNGVYWP